MPNAATALEPVEKLIAAKLILCITGQLVNVEDRAGRYGGLGVLNPTQLSSHYTSSCLITQSLQCNIQQLVMELGNTLCDVYAAKKEAQTATRNTVQAHALALQSSLPPEKRLSLTWLLRRGHSAG